MQNTFWMILLVSIFASAGSYFIFSSFIRELLLIAPVVISLLIFRYGPVSALVSVTCLYMIFIRASGKINLSVRYRITGELLVFYLAYLLDFRISFVQWDNRFIYFDLLSPVLTVLWIFLTVRIFRFLGGLKGSVPGVIIIFTVILFMVSGKQNDPLYFAKELSLILSGISVWYLILSILGKYDLRTDEVSLLGFLTGIMTITGVTKRVAFVALIFPSFFVILPFFFIASFVFYFYLRENLTEIRKSTGYKIIWRFTRRRALTGLYFIFIYLSVWIFTLLAKMPALHKSAVIITATFAMICLIFVLTVKLDIPDRKSAKQVKILDILINSGSRQQIMEDIENLLNHNRQVMITTPNAIAFVIARHDTGFCEALKRSDFNIPDGAGVIWAADVLETPLGERITGVDFMLDLIKKAEEQARPVYFLGSTDEVLDELSLKLEKSFPDLIIAGKRNGYFKSEEEAEIVQNIKKSGADYLFVAMGMPRQELFISRYLEETGCRLAIGVGGAFNVHSGVTNRAPKSFQVCGMEWLWRFTAEPWRLFRSWQLFYFVFLVLYAKISDQTEPL